jgi:hypothetical protein
MSWAALDWCAGLGRDVKAPKRGLLWAMCYHADRDTGVVTAGLRTLGAEAGVSAATAMRLRAELEADGLCCLVRSGAGTRPASYRVAFHQGETQAEEPSVSPKVKHKQQRPRRPSVSSERPSVSSAAPSVSSRAKRNPNPNPSVPTGVPKGGGESSAALAPAGAAPEPGQQEQEEADNGEPARIKREDWWPLLHSGRRPPSTAEERAAEEEAKRARALRLLGGGAQPTTEDRQRSGPAITERNSA